MFGDLTLVRGSNVRLWLRCFIPPGLMCSAGRALREAGQTGHLAAPLPQPGPGPACHQPEPSRAAGRRRGPSPLLPGTSLSAGLCMGQVEWVGVQWCVFNLLLRYLKAFIIAEAYDYTPDWAEVLYQKVILKGDFAYLDEFKHHRPLPASLFEEISKKYVHFIYMTTVSMSRVSPGHMNKGPSLISVMLSVIQRCMI